MENKKINLIAKFFNERFGIDKAILNSVIWKLWQIIAGIGNIVLITLYLTHTEQGYLYTFQSLLIFQVLFDLGLSSILLQYAAHEMAYLKWDRGKVIAYENLGEKAKSRLASLIKICFKWYLFAGLLMFFFLSFGGFYFFKLNGSTNEYNINWQLPWTLTVFAFSIITILNPFLGILEGCGKVSEVASFRLLQDIFSTILYWVSLNLGFGLYALSIFLFSKVFILLMYFLFIRRIFFCDLLKYNTAIHKVSYKIEILPFQSKFFLAAISSLITSTCLVPMVFVRMGAIPAGQLGMSLQIVNAIFSISLVWITTKTPIFCNYISLKDYNNLDKIFKKFSYKAFYVLIILSVCIMFLLFLVNTKFPKYSYRVTDTLTFFILIISVMASFPNFAFSCYLRAHKQEVTALANLTISFSILTLIYFAPKNVDLSYVSFVLLLGNVTLSLWVYLLYRRYKLLWHDVPSIHTIEEVNLCQK